MTDPIAIVRSVDQLAELAAMIQTEHTAVCTSLRKGIAHARSVGELLNRAKSLCPHGQWLPWLEANCPEIGARQAQKYMRLAASPNAPQSSHLPINDALAILAQEQPAEPKAYSGLPLYDAAREIMRRMRDTDPVESIDDPVEKLRAYAEIVNDINVEISIARIKLRAMRRIGEISKEMDEAPSE